MGLVSDVVEAEAVEGVSVNIDETAPLGVEDVGSEDGGWGIHGDAGSEGVVGVGVEIDGSGGVEVVPGMSASVPSI